MQKIKKHKATVLICVVAVILVIGLWLKRLPENYAYMFLGNYDGTEDAIDAISCLKLTDDEAEAMNENLEEYDDFRQQNLEVKLSFTGANNDEMSAYYYNQNSEVTVVLLGSFTEDKDSDYIFASYYYDKGYNILIPDMRNEGESEGEYVSWGDLESEDLVNELNQLSEMYGEKSYIIHGKLIGASTALLAMKNMPDNVMFIVAEEAYPSFDELASEFVSNILRIPSIIGMPLFKAACNNIFGIDITAIDICDGITQDIPVLLVYAENDEIISENMIQELENALGDAGETLEIEGARYKNFESVGKDKIESHIDSYITEYFK
ncbi:MAG: alpha/beta hydrolase [Eubacterium sp.]|nr:alpha/beta hydrolase [Eubacterium sp.]